MDFKKAYEDALERAKGIYNENPSSSTAKVVCGQIFPELTESEDERIRKDIVKYLTNELNNVEQPTPRTNEFERWIAWLEKQKEQKPAEWNDAERKKLYSDGFHAARNALAGVFMQYFDEHLPEGKMCLSNGECAQLEKAFKDGDVETIVRYINKYQQTAGWSGEDDAALDFLHELISFGYTKGFFDAQTAADMRKWVNTRLKSLHPQPKQEWSEEDNDKVDDICKLIEHATIIPRSGDDDTGAPPTRLNDKYKGELKAFVESLRNRLIKSDTWKPSEEQMDALNEAVGGYRAEDTASCETTAEILESLYKDLEKL